MFELTEDNVQELIGRKLDIDLSEVLALVNGAAVMVTGAGGSIGSALALQLIAFEPRTLILYESNEFALYEINRKVQARATRTKIVPVLGNLNDIGQLVSLLDAYQVRRVYHAAAYKHVPLVERNPIAGVRNNVIATQNLVTACDESHVADLVMISTDKAVRPTNVMGGTKRLAEYAVLASPKPYRVVRFGNVLGSNGSVIPLFLDQLSQPEPVVTVTHKDVTRYFMSIREAVGLVLQSSLVYEGQICVLDMGEQVKIADLANRLIQMVDRSGAWIDIIGLRPGEKLYEELTLGDSLKPTHLKYISVAEEPYRQGGWVREMVSLMERLCEKRDVGGIRAALGNLVPGYAPACGIVDDLWLEENVFQFSHLLDDCFEPTARP